MTEEVTRVFQHKLNSDHQKERNLLMCQINIQATREENDCILLDSTITIDGKIRKVYVTHFNKSNFIQLWNDPRATDTKTGYSQVIKNNIQII